MDCKLLNGYNANLQSQMKVLEEIVMSNETLKEVITKVSYLGIENYYIGAGCIAQTVWNYMSGNPLEYGINDIDFAFFNDERIDYEYENSVVLKMKELFGDLKIDIDVKNQARVHLWYEKHFGYSIEPYTSLESALNTWPTTATAIGVRKERSGEFTVYAPYGLNDLFGMVVRANKVQVTKEIYESKVRRWLNAWPDLKVIPWDN